MKWFLLTLAISAVTADLQPTCQKQVYCNSKLLHYVQMSRIYHDSKSFVDLQMKADEKTILQAFDVLLNQTNSQPTRNQIQEFVDHFFVVFDELENWTPTDYQPNPSFISKIKDKKLQQFGRDVNALWPTLGRKVKTAVVEKKDLFSIIPVQNGFIIPGGRTKELYYWDTYWIVEGLLVSGMKNTVKGIISNLIDLQREFGHVPSGARWYYQERSQPPLLSAMMFLYIEATKDFEFLKANIDTLEAELEYWLDTQSVVFSAGEREYTLLRYFSPSQGPRPEFYYEDFTNAQVFETEEARTQFYVELKSAAESGWDFSSRWFVNKDGSNKGNLTNTHTSEIIPVDLNAMFINAMQKVAYFHVLLEKPRRGVHWAVIAKQWGKNMNEVMWNEADGIWYDYDLATKTHRKYVYPSNVAPLWMEVVDKEFIKAKADKIVQYLKKTQSLEFVGGVPASLIRTGEQWDFPNAWPPLVSMMVSALESLQTEESTKLAFQVAQTWVRACYKGYISSKQLFEKYDVEKPGKAGLGEEYTIQPGFGWTNGAVLEMLVKYGDSLTAQDASYGSATFKAVPLPSYLNSPVHSVSHEYGVSVQPGKTNTFVPAVQHQYKVYAQHGVTDAPVPSVQHQYGAFVQPGVTIAPVASVQQQYGFAVQPGTANTPAPSVQHQYGVSVQPGVTNAPVPSVQHQYGVSVQPGVTNAPVRKVQHQYGVSVQPGVTNAPVPNVHHQYGVSVQPGVTNAPVPSVQHQYGVSVQSGVANTPAPTVSHQFGVSVQPGVTYAPVPSTSLQYGVSVQPGTTDSPIPSVQHQYGVSVQSGVANTPAPTVSHQYGVSVQPEVTNAAVPSTSLQYGVSVQPEVADTPVPSVSHQYGFSVQSEGTKTSVPSVQQQYGFSVQPGTANTPAPSVSHQYGVAVQPGVANTPAPTVSHQYGVSVQPEVTNAAVPSTSLQYGVSVQPGVADTPVPSVSHQYGFSGQSGGTKTAVPSVQQQYGFSVQPGAANTPAPSVSHQYGVAVQPGVANTPAPTVSHQYGVSVQPEVTNAAVPSTSLQYGVSVQPGVADTPVPSVSHQYGFSGQSGGTKTAVPGVQQQYGFSVQPGVANTPVPSVSHQYGVSVQPGVTNAPVPNVQHHYGDSVQSGVANTPAPTVSHQYGVSVQAGVPTSPFKVIF